MITKIITEYLTFDSFAQPTSIDVQLSFKCITDEERQLIQKFQELFNAQMISDMEAQKAIEAEAGK